MLKSIDNHDIQLLFKENRFMNIFGKSGSGKTYCAWRLIEELSSKMPVLIVDYSSSYTEFERRKITFSKNLSLVEHDVKNDVLELCVGRTSAKVVENVVDALVVVLGIGSMMQRKILKEACEEVMHQNGFIDIASVFQNLELYLDGFYEEDVDHLKNVNFLLSRLYHLKNVNTLHLMEGDFAFELGASIYQLSDFSMRLRFDLAQFVLELIWRAVEQNPVKTEVQLILDEFQNLKLKDSAVESIVREGRRHGLGGVFLSQFPPDKESNAILEQATVNMYFRPIDQLVTKIAKMVAKDDYKEWVNILRNLEKGSCVLDGQYAVNGNEAAKCVPIVCKVH